MGWWANFKANRDLSDARREVGRSRTPYAISQYIDKCIELQRLDLAYDEAERGIQEYPESESLQEAYKRMIRAKCANDLKAYRDEIRKSPGPKAYYRLACLYKEMRDLDQAVELARKGIELYPNFEGNYIVLADVRYERFQHDLRAADGLEAIDLFERAVDLNRENYRLLFQLAEIYRAVGATEHAIDKAKLILNFAPDDRNALALLTQLKEAKPPKTKDLKEILSDFERRTAQGALRRQGVLAQRYARNADQLARKLPALPERIQPGFQRVVVLGPNGDLLAGHPGGPEENRKVGEVLKKIFSAAQDCSLRMDISTFEKGFYEGPDGFTYLLMADRLQIAILCSNKTKKEKMIEEVHRFVEHDLYL